MGGRRTYWLEARIAGGGVVDADVVGLRKIEFGLVGSDLQGERGGHQAVLGPSD